MSQFFNVLGVIALIAVMTLILYVVITRIDPWMSGREDEEADSDAG